MDLAKLGERTIWVDCDVIQADGGTRCVSITGSFIALVDADRWLREKGILKESIIKDSLAAISTGLKEGEELLDLSFQEDSQASVDMNVVMSGKGELVEIQVTGEEKTFSRKILDELLDLAETGVKKLTEIQRKVIGQEEWNWS